jgi:plasmid stabilization system protein ParE
MKKYAIFWTVTAVKQRKQVLEYWNDRNKSDAYSRKLILKISDRIRLLKTNPHMGKKTDFLNTRIISLGHYSILYREIEDNIIITGFWDNRQDPSKLLRFLKNNSF